MITPICVAAAVSVGDCEGSPSGVGSSAFANPKSNTFTVPSSRTLMLAGFRSRWMTPASCAASRASAICFAIGRASSRGIGPWAIRSASVGPSIKFENKRLRVSLRFFQPVDVPDVGMVQRGEDFGFALKPGEAIGIFREGLRQHLQRHVPVELGVSGSIHLPHAAFADLGGDLVGAEGGAGLLRASATVGEEALSSSVRVLDERSLKAPSSVSLRRRLIIRSA